MVTAITSHVFCTYTRIWCAIFGKNILKYVSFKLAAFQRMTHVLVVLES